MPLMDDAQAKAAAKEMGKILGKAKGRRYFMLGVKGSEATLNIGKRRFKATQLKSLKKDLRCQLVIHGQVEWGQQEGVYIFRSKQAKRAMGKWKTIKKAISKSAGPQFKTAPFKGALLQPMDGPVAVTSDTTEDRVLSSLDEFLLYQQQIFRDSKSRVDGVISPEELSLSNPDGTPVVLTPQFLASSGLDQAFTLLPDGSLKVLDGLLDEEDGISHDARQHISDVLLSVVQGGYELHLNNPDRGDQGTSMDLRVDGDHLEQTITHRSPASATNLHYDRDHEIVPGSAPPVSFREAINAMTADDCSAQDFARINTMLVDAFELEKEQGSVADGMTFMQYKMQFINLSVPSVDKDDLRWRDGDEELNAAEWSFLQLKVKDLPTDPQHYHWVTFKKKNDPSAVEDGMMVPFPDKALSQKDFEAYIKGRYRTDLYEFSIDEGNSFCYSLPGKRDLLPKLNDFPAGAMKALLADEQGAVKDPKTGNEVDLSDAGTLSDVAENTAGAISKTVMGAAMTRWTENAGESIGDLLKGIPDTQKVFLRQSNGADNADTVDGEAIGQDQVTSGGQNDNGAFGKCAPVSYFCGAISGIAVNARDALDKLKANSVTAAAARDIERLLTAVPCNEESRDALGAAIERARQAVLADWEAFMKASPAPSQKAVAAKRQEVNALWTGLIDAEQMKTSIVDRMVVKTDEEGPYMEMTFEIPRTRGSGYRSERNVRPGTKTVKVRPEDIQEYLEQTNRADGYRGGKSHMMDFFKDPASLNQIQLMENLGPGLIAVGIDKALKENGKKSGLLYGPGAEMVSSMVYNRHMKTDPANLSKPMTKKKGEAGYDKEFGERRGKLMGMLRAARDNGGGLSVSMGYSAANGHVNYVQSWGTPTVDGVEISSEDLARCHMNYQENSATTSAWQNDRNSSSMINTGKMVEGLTSIQTALTSAGKNDKAAELTALLDKARTAQAQLDQLARSAGYADADDWMQKATQFQKDADNLRILKENPDYIEYMDAVRQASADTMDWLKGNLTLNQDEGELNEDNVVVMPSNTERDNSVTDDPEDRGRTSGNNIGDQKRGSANAADASYFVPLNAMAGGWDGEKEKAKGYAHYADDTSDQFIMLKSMTVMHR